MLFSRQLFQKQSKRNGRAQIQHKHSLCRKIFKKEPTEEYDSLFNKEIGIYMINRQSIARPKATNFGELLYSSDIEFIFVTKRDPLSQNNRKVYHNFDLFVSTRSDPMIFPEQTDKVQNDKSQQRQQQCDEF